MIFTVFDFRMTTENSQEDQHKAIETVDQQHLNDTKPLHTGLVHQAFNLLDKCRARQKEQYFVISNERIDHSDIDEYIAVLLRQYKDENQAVRDFIQNLKYHEEGQEFIKAIVVGSKNHFSVSVIVASRVKSTTADEHKVVIATVKKSIDTDNVWNYITEPCGLKTSEEEEMKTALKQLNTEKYEKYLKAMALNILDEELGILLNNNIEVQYIENNYN